MAFFSMPAFFISSNKYIDTINQLEINLNKNEFNVTNDSYNISKLLIYKFMIWAIISWFVCYIFI